MQNFVKNVSKMQHYRPGMHLLGRMMISEKEGPEVMNGGGNL
jgi:hypothetical protein